jgi:hypothetical protein
MKVPTTPSSIRIITLIANPIKPAQIANKK